MENDKPDWKQWIPAYGMYKALIDAKDDKPSLATANNKIIYFGSMFYHGLASGIVILGLEKILK